MQSRPHLTAKSAACSGRQIYVGKELKQPVGDAILLPHSAPHPVAHKALWSPKYASRCQSETRSPINNWGPPSLRACPERQRAAEISPAQQRLSVAGAVSDLPRSAHAADAGRRLAGSPPGQKRSRRPAERRTVEDCRRKTPFLEQGSLSGFCLHKNSASAPSLLQSRQNA
jgi:hypothetical protein